MTRKVSALTVGTQLGFSIGCLPALVDDSGHFLR